MSDQHSEDMVTLTVDGIEMQAPKGAMLIEVTDRNNIHVPRFCYHDKLSVAANCRMCLVEVEKAPKPLPACATPVMDGMVVRTHSKYAKDAQKSVMEFLLINHPLDCPICDQGGECELQDVAMAYGNDASEFVEGKRVVLDKNIGPLISTELTRCIHCTRCVRFGEEIAGIRELGMTSRGENARIATYMSRAVSSELSGNVIDLCPVGALTAKPSRFTGRSWEMVQHATVAGHDCVGSNVFAHTLRGELIRVVPRDNEDINEVWIADRDRFSYEATDSTDRCTKPMIRQDGQWAETDWETALTFAASKLGSSAAALASPSATLEELYLLQKLMRAMGSDDIDHRLRQIDFTDQNDAPVMPWLGRSIASLEAVDSALLIGSNVRKEQPLIAHRLRKAAVRRGAAVHMLNTRQFDMNYEVASNLSVSPQHMVGELAAVAKACSEVAGQAVADNIAARVAGTKVFDQHRAIAVSLKEADDACVLLGEQASLYAQFAVIRQLAAAIAELTGADLGYLVAGANAPGAWLAGAVPHRRAGGEVSENVGRDASQIINDANDAVLLLHTEPDADISEAAGAMAMLEDCEHVVAVTAWHSDALKQVANVILPASAFGETSGTFVNIEGYWQSFNGFREPKGQARPGWKILRVLANQLGLDGFEHLSSEQVRDELRAHCEDIELDNTAVSAEHYDIVNDDADMMRTGDVPIYASDAMVRRAASLQRTADAEDICVRINHHEAERLGLSNSKQVSVRYPDREQTLVSQVDLIIDDSIPANTAWIPFAVSGNERLGGGIGRVTLEAVL